MVGTCCRPLRQSISLLIRLQTEKTHEIKWEWLEKRADSAVARIGYPLRGWVVPPRDFIQSHCAILLWISLGYKLSPEIQTRNVGCPPSVWYIAIERKQNTTDICRQWETYQASRWEITPLHVRCFELFWAFFVSNQLKCIILQCGMLAPQFQAVCSRCGKISNVMQYHQLFGWDTTPRMSDIDVQNWNYIKWMVTISPHDLHTI